MARILRSLIILSLAVIPTLALSSSHHALAAGPTGVYDILIFPGATSTDCGTWAVYSTDGVDQPGPSNYVETMTDGLGNVVYSRTSAGGIGTFTLWGSGSFDTQPQANPIHEYVVMDGVVITDVYASNPCVSDAVYQGVPIPAGFVLRTITCNTPVYDTAGGSPLVTGEAVTAGQTWFVSPTPTGDWTEIFNAGVLDGFVPSSCIGGKPANYDGA